jgi:hypothetical protein
MYFLVSWQNYSNFYYSDSFEPSFQNILRKQKILTIFKIKIYLKIKKRKRNRSLKIVYYFVFKNFKWWKIFLIHWPFIKANTLIQETWLVIQVKIKIVIGTSRKVRFSVRNVWAEIADKKMSPLHTSFLLEYMFDYSWQWIKNMKRRVISIRKSLLRYLKQGASHPKKTNSSLHVNINLNSQRAPLNVITDNVIRLKLLLL